MFRRLSSIVAGVAAIAAMGAAPNRPAAPSGAAFPPAIAGTQANGVIVVSQIVRDMPVVGAQVFLPAGLALQTTSKAGVAAVAAAMILKTAVDGKAGVADVARDLGGSVTYTVDPEDTRFYLECKSSDLPRLLRDLDSAIERPDSATFGDARAAAESAADAALKDPVLVAYGMIRQVEYAGNGFAHFDAGRPIALHSLTADDALAFASQYRHGPGTVVALSGDVTDDALAAAKSAFARFPSTAPSSVSAPKAPGAGREVITYRAVSSPWIAVGFKAPSQFSTDYPAMLVIEALLGRGGDVHAFSYGSESMPPSDFLGGFYQYEAQPGVLVEFYNGANVDQDLRNLKNGIARIRATPLAASLLQNAKRVALGDYYTSITTLDDESWLLGRSALSPSGVSFESSVPARIAAVTAADVQRVARAYLSGETIAAVLPSRGQ